MAANNPNPNPDDAFMANFNQELERLRRLEEQMDPAMGRIRAKTEQIAAVVNQIRGALEALTAQVTALADRIRGAQEEKARLEAEIARLRALPNQQAQLQQLQARVDELTRIITDATPQLTQLGDKILALMAAADEGGITPDQVAAITRDVEAIGEQTRLLSLMLPPPPANGEAPVDQIPPPAGGGKKAKKTKKTKRRTRKMRKTKGRKQRGGYNWITPGSSSRGKSASSSSRTRNTKRRNKKSRSSL
jgi:chromosome segregation ATPase